MADRTVGHARESGIVRVSEFTVNVVADDIPDRHHWAITVADRGNGLWAVTRHGACLSGTGTWDYEPLPSGRTSQWLEDHRFDLHTALDLAIAAAPDVTANGQAARDVAL